MKKIIIAVFIAFIISNFTGFVQAEETLFDIRTKIFNESKELRPLVNSKRDAILANSMWDTCIIAVTQLDAYFSMLGILNTIENEGLTPVAVKYLTDWLKDIKLSGDANLAALNESVASDKTTKNHIKKMKALFKELNEMVDVELEKINIVIKALKIKRL